MLVSVLILLLFACFAIFLRPRILTTFSVLCATIFDLFCFCFHVFFACCDACFQSSEELDTDTEFEPVEDMTIETRSRCKDIILSPVNSLMHAYFVFSSQSNDANSNRKHFFTLASAHTGDQTIDEYPDISGITTARVSFNFHHVMNALLNRNIWNPSRKQCER